MKYLKMPDEVDQMRPNAFANRMLGQNFGIEYPLGNIAAAPRRLVYYLFQTEKRFSVIFVEKN